MVTNEELFKKMMRFSREVRNKKCHPWKDRGGEKKGCWMPPMMRQGEGAENGDMPQMPPMPPMHGMPPMPGMFQRPPHCGGPFGKGPHGPGGRHGHGMSRERLLVIMSEYPEGVWQKDLAWEADINASSASELIGKLEEAGKQRAEETRTEREGFLGELFSKLTEEEKETLSNLLDKLLN